MTLLDKINKAIDARNARSEAQKFAWQKASDTHFYKRLVVNADEQAVLIHVVGDKVYRSDKYMVNVEEITGQEAEDYIASATATMALRSTQADGSGGIVKSLFSAAEGMANSVAESEMASHQPKSQHSGQQPHPLEGLVSMPSPEPGKPNHRRAQTYEEWMGFE
jgi:hypothetical protein